MTTSLQEEINSLNLLMEKSLLNDNTTDGIKPVDLLIHTKRVKEIIISLFDNGDLSIDKNKVNYILVNIESQEDMIKKSYAAYAKGDVSIYTSQVGACLSGILKEIATLK